MQESLKLKLPPTKPCGVDYAWYNMIRAELLRKAVPHAEQVLDVGCGKGEELLTLSKQIRRGVGVDISGDDIVIAENMRKKRGIDNLEFMKANAVSLPFESNTFDVVLCLGDVLSYFDPDGQECVLNEIKRVLIDGGLTVYEGMDWNWEYRDSPYWTCFIRADDGGFHFHRSERTTSGLETGSEYEVVPGTPLHNWILQQDWPVSPQGYNTTLDVIEEEPIPEHWLKLQDTAKAQNYTPHALKRKYESIGFRDVEAFSYGQTYDIVCQAGLFEAMRQWMSELAKAEAEMVFQLRMGSGPWIFLLARAELLSDIIRQEHFTHHVSRFRNYFYCKQVIAEKILILTKESKCQKIKNAEYHSHQKTT